MLDQLPDDVLAMVMSHLVVKDLMACRLLCKRLAALSRHPDVWRHRRFRVDHGGRRWCPLLRLAPCVRKISTILPLHALQCRHSDLQRAACAARELSITAFMETCGAEEAGAAVVIIRQQEALGRLRALTLDLRPVDLIFSNGKHYGILTADSMHMMVEALSSTTDLEVVELTAGNRRRASHVAPAAAGLRGAIAPSLKSFTCDILPWTLAFCNDMLTRYAATLEVVDLADDDLSPFDAALSPLRRLARMPNLRHLTSRVMPGLGAVVACESLRSLKLNVEPVSADDAPGALQLLCNAHQLKFLHLDFLHDGDEADTDYPLIDGKLAADLIGALASSGQSQVEELIIEVQHGTCLPSEAADQLRLALPSLPSLRRLVVNLAPFTLLGGISSLTAPSLRSLQIGLYDGDYRLCFHVLLHDGALASLMSRNPLLHVELQRASCAAHEGFDDLCVGLPSCHQDLKKLESVGIFAHPKGECPSPEAHSIKRCNWFHINDFDL